MESVYDHLVTVLQDKFEADADEIRPEATLASLELDSLAVVELYVTLQEHWGVALEEDDAAAEMALHKLAQTVAAQLSAAGAATDSGAPQ
ncbi:acyl carrier protein [Streptomyces natalensis]|uniref:Acyl carrier protein n=1 Tax=Streptomyces natalensis ATCC 27448 TaxID=1240678 RepID=A0A0D7CJ17_9ACTN|nr:phosphopantetheine-binding protein [Streptomyces natalensis]KIZ16188.1 acyl carrier protein [Streptomyces natalensis ATCC 27448]